jgi:hypothetical protein
MATANPRAKRAGIRDYLLPGRLGDDRATVQELEADEHGGGAGGGAECERPARSCVVGSGY